MFDNENLMSLSLQRESADLDILKDYIKQYYNVDSIVILNPVDGIRNITSEESEHFSGIIIQENKKYKFYA